MLETSAPKKVVVIGAGFSGLMAAFYLQEAGYKVEIHEKSDRPGGLIRTHATTFGLVETAANAFMNSYELERVSKRIGLKMLKAQPAARARYIFRDKPSRFPVKREELFAFFKFVLRFIFFRDGLAPRAKETVAEWGARVLGPTLSFFTVETALQGVYAGDPKRMSASLILRRLFIRREDPKPKIKGSVAPAKGMNEFAEKIIKFLTDNGVEIHYKSDYKIPAKLPCPHVIATSAHQAAELLRGVAPETSEQLAKVEYLPMITATLFWDASNNQVKGFGCLFPPNPKSTHKSYILGMLMNNYIFKGRANDSLSETWMLGGARALESPEFFDLDDERILERIRKRRAKTFGSEGRLLNYKITRWQQALPHYTVDHEERLASLSETYASDRQVYLVGNYLGQIGLSQMLNRGQRVVRQIKEVGMWE